MSLVSPDLSPAPETFFIYPVNARYLAGKTTRIRTRQRIEHVGHAVALILLLIVGIVFAITSISYWRAFSLPPSDEQITTLGATTCFALIPLILVGTGIPTYRRRLRETRERHQRLQTEGQIIPGEVISYDVNWRQTLFTRQGETGARMRYRFRTPQGGERLHTYRWSQVPGFRKPEPGAILAILYVDDTLHEVL